MRLNLPIIDQLAGCQNILIAGMGGGYDVFCGLPIYFELKTQGLHVHLANYSFSEITKLKDGIRLTDTLVGITADIQDVLNYFPERHLTQWFREQLNQEITVWCFEKTGARPLLENYGVLIEHLKIDGILLIDGGIDSLLRGDETEIGTVVEDTISLIAVSEIKGVRIKLLGCIGLGAEKEILHAQVFENISKLTEAGAFLGSCTLVSQMESYQLYEAATTYVQSQPRQESSVINASVLAAVQGKFGNYHTTDKTQGSRLWISPLMPIYWFFDAQAIARRSLLFSALRYTDTLTDALRALLQTRRTLPARKSSKIQLP
ncbi:MAG: DUF1152 domain-containing protein [Anaerolineae bacterium]|nr:DUF1152 domain-containing protein [Anaerolineae bacterium]